MERAIRVESDGGRLRAEGPDQTRSSRWAVSYRLFVPREIDLDVDATNGGVTIKGVEGEIDIRSVNGPLSITSLAGNVRGRTTNGPLSVRLEGSRWSGKGLDLETVNGPVTVTIPENYSAALEAGTRNGPLDIEFPVTVQGRVGRRISTVLGAGGPTIRAVTVNGPLVLQRPQDE